MKNEKIIFKKKKILLLSIFNIAFGTSCNVSNEEKVVGLANTTTIKLIRNCETKFY